MENIPSKTSAAQTFTIKYTQENIKSTSRLLWRILEAILCIIDDYIKEIYDLVSKAILPLSIDI